MKKKNQTSIDEWDDKLKLLSILSTTKEFLMKSPKYGWPDEDAKEIIEIINNIIQHIFNHDQAMPKYSLILYAPTGPIQEIAISNGWSDIYMKLANEYDKVEYIIRDT